MLHAALIASLLLSPAAVDPRVAAVLEHNASRLARIKVDPDFIRRSDAHHAATGVPQQKLGPGGPVDPAVLAATSLHGEIIVMEADDQLVSSDGSGGYSIRTDGARQDTLIITQRAIQMFGDNFDFVTIFTMFQDAGAPGALAYEISASNDASGIGSPVFSDAAQWGSPSGRLRAFVNMMYVYQWDAPNDPAAFLYPVWGQETAHAWLSFLRFRRPDGSISMDMLGRDQSHWSALLDSEGSVMDGMDWVPNADGTYTMQNSMFTFSPLDQYAMGLRRADEVPPWFLLQGATSVRTGNMFTATTRVASGAMARVTGREDITIEQVVGAEGQRQPSANESPSDFRMAIVLVTSPGQPASDSGVTQAVAVLESARQIWETQFRTFTGGRGSVCTQVTAACNAPTARVGRATVTELGDGDSVLEPAERAKVAVALTNSGVGAADGVTATLEVPAGLTVEPAMIAVGTIAEGQSAMAEFTVTFGAGVCGQKLAMTAKSKLGMREFTSGIEVLPGVQTVRSDDLEGASDGFRANPTMMDTATMGAWELAAPAMVGTDKALIQPGGCHSGTKCWVTGAAAGMTYTANSVKGGATTLETARMDLSGVFQPTLSFWHFLANYDDGGSTPGSANTLDVLASLDDQTWTKLETIRAVTNGWAQHSISLAPLFPMMTGPAAMGTQVRFRFVATNTARTGTIGARLNVLEAGLDDLAILGASDGCRPAAMPPDGGAGGSAGAPDGGAAGGAGNAGQTGGAGRGAGGRSGATETPKASDGGCATGGAGAGGLFGLGLLALGWLRRRR